MSNFKENLNENNQRLLAIKQKIGNNFEGSSSPAQISITYSALKNLRDNSALIPGAFYRITDYQCTTAEINTIALDNQFDIIIQALDVSKLSENASATLHEGDTYFIDCNLESWELKYCLDNDTNRFSWANDSDTGKGVIYYMKDHRNNEVGYDFTNIAYKGSSIYNYEKFNLDSGTYYTTFSYSNLVYYYQWGKQYAVSRNTSIDQTIDGEDYYGYTCSSKPDAWPSANFYILDTDINDSSVMYQLYEDESISEINFGGNLIFKDSLVIPPSNKTINHNKLFKPNNFDKYGDFVFIYRLNKIIFFGDNCYGNSFDNECHDNTFSSGCYKNTFGYQCNSNSFDIGCHNNSFGNCCYHNKFNANCYSNVFQDECTDNFFDKNCSHNIFSDCATNNSFAEKVEYNTFGRYFMYNTLDHDCSYNTFGSFCCNNKIGNYSTYNIFGNECFDNIFGEYCTNNTFSNNCNNNKFGNNCSFISFSSNCYDNTFSAGEDYMDYLTQIHFGEGCLGVTLYNEEPGSDTNYVQNVTLSLGVKNCSLVVSRNSDPVVFEAANTTHIILD